MFLCFELIFDCQFLISYNFSVKISSGLFIIYHMKDIHSYLVNIESKITFERWRKVGMLYIVCQSFYADVGENFRMEWEVVYSNKF